MQCRKEELITGQLHRIEAQKALSSCHVSIFLALEYSILDTFSDELLYTIGRTSEIDLSTALGTLNWNDSISLDEKDGLEISVDSEYNRDGRGIITFNILNKSNSTKILDNIDIYSEDKIEEAKMYSSNYTNNYKADGEENNITVSLSDYGKNNYSGIGPGRSANIKIVIYYDEAPSGNISILNYNCK